MIDELFTVLLVTGNILINLLFLKCFFQKGRFTAKDICLICLFIIEGSIVSIALHSVVLLKLILNLVTDIVVTALVFKVSWIRSVVYNLLFFGMYASIEIVVLFTGQFVFSSDNYANLTNEGGAAVMEIICYLIMLLVIVLINIIHRKSIITRLDTKGWIAFIMYPATTLCVITLLLYIPKDQISQTVFRILLFFAVCMLFLGIMQFYLLENIMQREFDIYNKQALIERNEHTNQMYRSLSEEREIQKARAHDYLNHLNTLLALAEKDDKTREIKYLKDQIKVETDSIDLIDTGDPVINAVLNIKYREAKTKGIIMPLILDDLSDLKISDSDIVTILSNILDNAIEATEQCDTPKIVLRISKQVQEKKLCIDSSNTCKQQIYDDKKRFTTKGDKENHGFGITNIRYAVEKNNGECIIDSKDGMFRIVITIPL